VTAPGYYFHFEHDIYPPIGPAEGLTGLCQMAGLYDDMLSWRGRAEYVNAKGERFGIGIERLRSHAITYSPDPYDDDTPVTFLTVGELREGDMVDREADFWLTYDNPDADHELLIAQAQTYEVSAHSAPYDGPDGAVVDVHYEFDSSCGYPPGFTLPVVFRAPDEGEGYGYCDVCGAMCEAGDDGNGYCPLNRLHDAYSGESGNPSTAEREFPESEVTEAWRAAVDRFPSDPDAARRYVADALAEAAR